MTVERSSEHGTWGQGQDRAERDRTEHACEQDRRQNKTEQDKTGSTSYRTSERKREPWTVDRR